MSVDERMADLLQRTAGSCLPGTPPPAGALRAQARRRRLRHRMAAAGALVAVVAGATVLRLSVSRERHVQRVATGSSRPAASTTTSSTVPTATVARLAAGRWSPLPAAPITARDGEAIVWTGRELLVWGGASGRDDQQDHADGAAFEPATGRWRKLAAAPLAARFGPAAVWTGHEMVVWGGYSQKGPPAGYADGAAYDPVRNSWRKLPAAPLSPRYDAGAVWTGSEMIILGGRPGRGSDRVGAATGAATYDPAKDRWRNLPAPPQVPGIVQYWSPVWAGHQLLVWALFDVVHETSPGHSSGTSGIVLLAYEPKSDTWRQVPDASGSPKGVDQSIWTGSEVIVPAARSYGGSGPGGPVQTNLSGRRYDPGRNTWRPIPHGPVDDALGPAVWTGRALLKISTSLDGPITPGDTAAWDPATNRWTKTQHAPIGGPTEGPAIWTGHEVIVLNVGYAPAGSPIGYRLRV